MGDSIAEFKILLKTTYAELRLFVIQFFQNVAAFKVAFQQMSLVYKATFVRLELGNGVVQLGTIEHRELSFFQCIFPLSQIIKNSVVRLLKSGDLHFLVEVHFDFHILKQTFFVEGFVVLESSNQFMQLSYILGHKLSDYFLDVKVHMHCLVVEYCS